MTLAISALKNLFPLHTKTQDYQLSIPMYSSECRNVDFLFFVLLYFLFFHFEEVTHVDKWNHIGN
jgi:hypothetical protein